jgi:thiol:disulfide interchange protein
MPTLRRTFASATGLLALVLAPPTLAAQEHPITWSLRTRERAPQQGKQFLVTLAAQIPYGWHLYSTTQPPGGPVQTVIGVAGDEFVMTGGVRVRDPDLAPDNNFNIITETYSDSATFTLPITARVAGKRTLHVRVHYQTCTDRYCLPPADEALDLAVQLAPGVLTPAAAAPPAAKPAVVPAMLAHPIVWTLSTEAGPLQQGKPFRAAPHAAIPPGWHLYSTTEPAGGPKPTTFIVAGDSSFVITGPPGGRVPERALDQNFNIITETYADSITFALPIAARVAGARTLRLGVRYQACTDTFCHPPRTDTIAAAVELAPGDANAVVPPYTPAVAAAGDTPGPGGRTTQSLVLFLWLAAGMGALSLLTPCVFPMIPITVSYFTRTRETARGHPARNAAVYAAGIIATFTVLGMAIAILVGAGGINRFAANPWINLLVTGIFVAFALNLFGVYEIGLPASVLTRLDAVTRRAGGSETAGILLMGLTFTLTSFTCTTPFVGTLLVMAAQGSWIWPLAGLLVFSAVFALPFFLLALMPSAVARLPRSGEWLQSVKVVMGFVELATAMKFLSNADLVLRWGVFSRTVVLAVWLGLGLLTALYLVGLVGRPAGAASLRPGPVRIMVTLATLLITGYLALGLSGRRMGELESFLPPPEGAVAGGETAVKGELSWHVNDFEGGLALARNEHKAVLVDFTGYTCTNCRWMEANMFPRPEVSREMAKFVRVRLYTDGEGELYQRQQKMEQDKLGTVALPYYAIVDSFGNVTARFLGMTRSTDEFVQFLRTGRSVTAP